MVSVTVSDQRRVFLATARATRLNKRVAAAIAAVTLLTFAVFVRFARLPLAPVPAFIPSYEAVRIFIDLTTAVLLSDQCARLRSSGVLTLGCGYLFDALIIIPHALSFSGAVTPNGLLGALILIGWAGQRRRAS